MARDSVHSERLKEWSRKNTYEVRPRNSKPYIKTEPMLLQKQLTEVNLKIKALTKQKHKLIKQIKAGGGKVLRPIYLEKTIYLYVLKLENGCWYIGMTRNVRKRFELHKKNKGSMWTRKNKPIEIHQIISTKTNDDSEASAMEDQLTLDWAEAQGYDYVRGGGYCQTKPRWPHQSL